MTDETKKLFDAPWRAIEHHYDNWFSVIDSECDFDFETFIQNEGCGCCEGIFRENWKLLRKVRDGK